MPHIEFMKLQMALKRLLIAVSAFVFLAGVSSPALVFAEGDATSTSTTPATTTTSSGSSTPTDTTAQGTKTDTTTPASSSSTSADQPPAGAASPSDSGSSASPTTAPTTPPSDTPTTLQASPKTTTTTAPVAGKQAAGPQGATGPQIATGPQAPNGPDAHTFTYNPATGMWENQYYIWNPITKQTTPKTPPTYSYNPTTGRWDTTQWRYDAPSGKYIPNIVSTVVPPASVVDAATKLANNLSVDNGSNGIFNNFFNATISNHLNVSASTGDASVTENTNGGSASSGNAYSTANVLNMLQSSSSLTGSNATTFQANVYGDVQGDIAINPGALNQSPTGNDLSGANLAVNTSNNQAISNDITLTAASGDATVSKNTTGGSATTGNADAIANVINMINAMITAQQSFVGVVNIYGNLNGNITMPQEFLDQLLASNAPTATIDSSAINNLSSTVNNNQSINNQVNTAAASGNANVTDNTQAGSATTGNASTKVTVFNLTGSQFIGANTLLVFVNVMGQWVGLLMNAPAGATAAAYGSGVTETAVPASNTAVNATNNQQINNNITVAAQSGNANVTDNTQAGSATTGNAHAGVNLLNITNSSFSLSHWFGVLFINVFGNWFGSFGVSKPILADTNGATTNSGMGAGGSPAGSVLPASQTNSQMKVFAFIPKATGSVTGSSSTGGSGTSGDFQLVSAKVSKALSPVKSSASRNPMVKKGFDVFNLVGAIAFVSGLSLFGIERYIKIRRQPHTTI